MDWTRSVICITGADAKPKGTGFVVAREGDDVLVVTCWHVVNAIGDGQPHIHGRPTTVCPGGDATLDLALLRLPASPLAADLVPLALTAAGQERQAVVTYGYGADGVARPLRARLDALTACAHPTASPVRRWDFYLAETEQDAFRRLKDGYSGSPVCDPDSGRVVAVATMAAHSNDKGHAIDIGELPRVWPSAAAWLTPRAAPPENRGEYCADPGEPLVKLLDHQAQLRVLQPLLRRGGSHLVLVEAGAHDWPQYLADRLYLDPCPEDLANAPTSEDLAIDPERDDAFRAALIDKTPRATECADPAVQFERGRGWVHERGRLVCYAWLDLAGDDARLRSVLHDARATLARIGDLRPGAWLLVLIVLHRDGQRPPLWRRWFPRRTRPDPPGVTRLPPLAPLDDGDIIAWYERFPQNHRRQYDRHILKLALLDLLVPSGRISFTDARKCLIGDPPGTGALGRARRRG